MRNMLILLAAILAVLMLVAIGITRTDPFSRKKKKGPGPVTAIFSYIALAVHFFITVTAFLIYQQSTPAGNLQNDIFTPDVSTTDAIIADVETEPVATETDAPTTEAYRDPRLSFQPQAITQSEPGNFQLNWEIIVNDEIVESFTREDPICFELDKEYFALPGIATFRGSNYRDNATYGTALIEKETMGVAWSHRIGSLDNWGGCAWTGQPLVVQWDDETKTIMDTLYDSKKEKDEMLAVATFSNARKWQKGEKVIRSYEWTRYASLPDLRISGGMGKMLKHFIKETDPDDIMSYADLEWSEGNAYEMLGFKLEGVKKPVIFKVNASWERSPVKTETTECTSLQETAGSLYFQNLGSNKYRLKLTDYQ
jgi:hypothetical protein